MKENKQSEPSEDSDDETYESEVESESEYCKGGYCKIKTGDKIKTDRYVILEKIGFGNFSTAWTAYDTKENKVVLLKIAKAKYKSDAEIEIKYCNHIKKKVKEEKSNYITVCLLDNFIHQSPNGKHQILVFNQLGKTLLSLYNFYESKTCRLWMVSQIAKQVLEQLDFLHSKCKVIHTDLKPENIILSNWGKKTYTKEQIDEVIQGKLELIESPKATDEPENENKVLLDKVAIIDYGNCLYFNEVHKGSYLQTRQYTAPEIVLGSDFDYRIDIWSCACIFFELAVGDFLFYPESKNHHGVNKNIHQLILFTEMLGKIPEYLRRHQNSMNAKKYFSERGSWRCKFTPNYQPLLEVLVNKHRIKPEYAKAFSSFLLRMLKYNYKERASAKELLEDKFITSFGEIASEK